MKNANKCGGLYVSANAAFFIQQQEPPHTTTECLAASSGTTNAGSSDVPKLGSSGGKSKTFLNKNKKIKQGKTRRGYNKVRMPLGHCPPAYEFKIMTKFSVWISKSRLNNEYLLTAARNN